MVPIFISNALQANMVVILFLAGLMGLFLMYYKLVPPQKCHPSKLHNTSVGREQQTSPVVTEKKKKPEKLSWPENNRLDLQDCKTHLSIDSCQLRDNRRLHSKGQDVLEYRRAIHNDLSSLPTSRVRFQRWIPVNMDSPLNTRRIPGVQGVFNLTLSCNRDADVRFRWKLTLKTNAEEKFLLPKQERLICGIVDSNVLRSKSSTFYRDLKKHMMVDIFHRSSHVMMGENYFRTIRTCKFYLSLENRDFITEIFKGSSAANSVPIVLCPPRRNYENIAPATSFIHVNNFPSADKLVDFLLSLDTDYQAYMSFFKWRQFYSAKRQLPEENHEFSRAICQAGHYVPSHKE